jgi:catechol 2,3-dioxygenase-like lactoylglutathione lyase family enzyme
VGLVQDIGHIVLQVGDMDAAVRLYRDVLGFAVPRGANPVWTVAAVEGGSITLFRAGKPVPLALPKNGTPINLHVRDFEEAARVLEGKGYNVLRDSANAGSLVDPWGNIVGLHDHRND